MGKRRAKSAEPSSPESPPGRRQRLRVSYQTDVELLEYEKSLRARRYDNAMAIVKLQRDIEDVDQKLLSIDKMKTKVGTANA